MTEIELKKMTLSLNVFRNNSHNSILSKLLCPQKHFHIFIFDSLNRTLTLCLVSCHKKIYGESCWIFFVLLSIFLWLWCTSLCVVLFFSCAKMENIRFSRSLILASMMIIGFVNAGSIHIKLKNTFLSCWKQKSLGEEK